MLVKEKINKKRFIHTRSKMNSEKFLKKFILPFEKSNKKENISENMTEYLIKIR